MGYNFKFLYFQKFKRIMNYKIIPKTRIKISLILNEKNRIAFILLIASI